jgi:ammonia channel protein AmtB
MLNVRVTTSATTVFAALSYLLCVAYGLLIPSSVNMHQLLQIVLPGFVWISPSAFFVGLVWAVAWGVYLGGGFVLTYNTLHRWMGSNTT